jgi:hypothetical protein
MAKPKVNITTAVTEAINFLRVFIIFPSFQKLCRRNASSVILATGLYVIGGFCPDADRIIR